jgi:hypothetical protein
MGLTGEGSNSFKRNGAYRVENGMDCRVEHESDFKQSQDRTASCSSVLTLLGNGHHKLA